MFRVQMDVDRRANPDTGDPVGAPGDVSPFAARRPGQLDLAE